MITSVSSPVDQRLRVDVAEQLDRILADEQFVASERSSRFLHYVVEQTLAGKAAEIKELVIATELYARAAAYDPKADSTVRVEASRVRGRLHRYYAHKGASDPIRITIPKGTYVPQFERAEPVAKTIDVALPASDARPRAPGPIALPRNARPVLAACALLLLVGAVVALAWWPWPMRALDGARGDMRSVGVHPEALAAWEEGNELLRQDPHSGLSSRGMPQTLDRAIERYELAVARSPRFPGGWASLAEAYEYASAYVGRQADEDARRAEEAARRAIALDPALPEGHAMLALVRFYLRWDFAGADVEYRRAIELNPRAAWAIVEYADLLRETDRLEQAAAEIRRARLLQPALPVLAIKEAEILLDQGQTDAAIATATAAVELKHDSPRAHVVLGTALEVKGDLAQALAHYRRALEMNAQDRRALPALGYLLGRIGHGDEARAILRRLEDLNERVRTSAYQAAVVHVGLGEHTQALDWLERAYQLRQMHVPFMVVDHRLEALHGSPRFQAIVRNLGLNIARRRA